MIRLESVSKHYEGAERPAVNEFSLEVAEGEVVVLIGPSGCGKSTTLRMINRLIEPDSGSLFLGDDDVRTLRVEELRRGIGYAIQGVGLFPHWSVRQNIGTVPRLLGWDKPRIEDRSRELLELVGLDPERYLEAYPDELSGGEAQRVGVARALAADPPVLLMDEPFGAVDPLTRDRLQREFLDIQRRLRKTVVFVTHDIDEAVRLGDRIAIMRDGGLVQYDIPERVLAYPADEFVAEFVGAERALKRLSLAGLRSVMRPQSGDCGIDPSVGVNANLREALSRILEVGEGALDVVAEDGCLVGRVSIEDILAHFQRPVA
ncbi:MAG: ABC transporter ATP-binding protein [Actinobacteria bacterium]|nr:ABC transporter ATP-binding protein [Actinomycetota bacterium]MCG2807056.1 ABC transporter ATP-binding protein [Coriobacteriia bacterium]